MEAQNLHELSKQNHGHLVRRIATVTHGKRFLILSDWANGGDLKKFWEQVPKPLVSPELVLEVVAQLRGLASAIKLMHHGYHASTLSHSVSQSPSLSGIPVPVVTGPDAEDDGVVGQDTAVEDSNWRHGDLKPANILRFLEDNKLVGTLRISDLGLAKQHPVGTGLRDLPSSSQFGTAAYEPPEAVTRRLAPRSRLYDIWSFGCVMFEFIVWLLYGQKGLKDFWDLPPAPEGTHFWSRLPIGAEPGAEVNTAVLQTINSIIATNAACRSPSALHDLLILIKDRVLLPALPDVHITVPRKNQRIDANELLKALDGIENKCKSRGYCCPGPIERNARLPIAPQPNAKNGSDSLRPPQTYGNGMASLQIPSATARAPRVLPARQR